MLVNVRDRVPSTEYTRTALNNKHRRSAAELLSLAYSGNETVTLVPATVECGTEAESFGEILCTNPKNQGRIRDAVSAKSISAKSPPQITGLGEVIPILSASQAAQA